jgi:hypothetical protein
MYVHWTTWGDPHGWPGSIFFEYVMVSYCIWKFNRQPAVLPLYYIVIVLVLVLVTLWSKYSSIVWEYYFLLHTSTELLMPPPPFRCYKQQFFHQPLDVDMINDDNLILYNEQKILAYSKLNVVWVISARRIQWCRFFIIALPFVFSSS